MAERLAPGGKSKDKDEGPIAVRAHHPLGRLVSLDAWVLVRECRWTRARHTAVRFDIGYLILCSFGLIYWSCSTSGS